MIYKLWYLEFDSTGILKKAHARTGDHTNTTGTLHRQVTSMKLFCFSNNLNCYSPATVQYEAQSTLAIYIHTTF